MWKTFWVAFITFGKKCVPEMFLKKLLIKTEKFMPN